MGFPNYDFSEISSFGRPDSGISKIDIHFNLENIWSALPNYNYIFYSFTLLHLLNISI